MKTNFLDETYNISDMLPEEILNDEELSDLKHFNNEMFRCAGCNDWYELSEVGEEIEDDIICLGCADSSNYF